MTDVKAFTLYGNTVLRVLRTDAVYEFPVVDPKNTPHNAVTESAIWDTGATVSTITRDVADRLGLHPTKQTTVRHAKGMELTNVYKVNIRIPNGITFIFVTVLEGSCNLIGMDIISLGDFSICNRDGKTVFSFQIPPTHCYDFVKQNAQGAGGKKKK